MASTSSSTYTPTAKRSELKGRNFWGPPLWELIHSLADKYTPEKKTAFLKFLILLTFILPCLMCRKNLIQKLKTIPPGQYLESSKYLLWYTYVIHDMANKHISKFHPDSPKVSPPYSDVVRRYKTQTPNSLDNVMWHVIHILATTLRYESGERYAEMLGLIAILIPNGYTGALITEFMKVYPIDPYLRNNNDAFTYSYMLHDYVAKKTMSKIQSYEVAKNFYFGALNEGCNDCKLTK